MTEKPLFGVYGLTFQWGVARAKDQKLILDEVSFELHSGEIIALLGPNGSGKSTLLKVVSGILSLRQPGCSGTVQHRGCDFLSMPTHRRAQKVAYVASEFQTEFPLSAQEAVSLGRTCQGHGFLKMSSQQDQEKVQWAMKACLCWDLRDRPLDRLSGGELQLVALARALAQGAKTLLLDETLSKMDLNHQSSIGKLLRELASDGWSIILVSHDVNLASEWATRGILLNHGKKIFDGSIQQTLSREILKLVYPDSDLVIGTNPITGAPKIFFS